MHPIILFKKILLLFKSNALSRQVLIFSENQGVTKNLWVSKRVVFALVLEIRDLVS
jgi:hypothetical protein